MWKWREFDSQGRRVWVVDILARLLGKEDIHGLLRQDVIIDPGEAAVFIRDGKIDDVMTQTRLKNVGGGFVNWLAGKVGVGENVQLLFVDTTPTDLEFGIYATTKEHSPVYGTCTVRLQISPENATKLINLIKKAPVRTDRVPGLLWDSIRSGQVLRKDDIGALLFSELMATVFTPMISQYGAEEFRGLEVQRMIENSTNIELTKTLELYGLTLLKMFIVWGKTDYDELMEYRRQYDIQIAKWDGTQSAYHQGMLADLMRRHEFSKREQENKWDMLRGAVSGEEGIATMRVSGALEREKMKTVGEAERADIVHGQAVKMERDKIGLARDRELARLEIEKLEDEQDALQLKRLVELKKDMKSHTVGEEVRLYQGTELERQKLAADVEKQRIQMEAEKAKYSLETFKEAEDREREHQIKMFEASAKMMEASKQKLPETLVQGQTLPVVQIGAKEEIKTCPSCGKAVRAGKFCSECGARF
ncbi:MAG: hypothetical protein AB1779_01815 [Candidatus Thermoplasmatota archaeon]